MADSMREMRHAKETREIRGNGLCMTGTQLTGTSMHSMATWLPRLHRFEIGFAGQASRDLVGTW